MSAPLRRAPEPTAGATTYRSVMLTVESHGDVQRLHWTTWRSRAVGYSVSTYAVRGTLIDSAFDGVGRELMA